MVRRIDLLVAGALAFTFVFTLAGFDSAKAFAADSCDHAQRATGLCSSSSTDGSEVTVGAARRSTKNGRPRVAEPILENSGNQKNLQGHSTSTLSDTEVQALQIAPCADVTICSTQKNNGINTLLINDPATVDQVQPADPAAPTQVVTAADVERFLPVVGELHAEPDGWAVVGVPANFWTEAQPVVVQGELLGEAADVRFTPRGYRWDYGDGTTRVTRTGGTSWADARQEELTATPTSHTYRQKAALDVAVTTIWSAEYRIAEGDWIDVAGAVTSTAPPAPMLVVRERTVLTGDRSARP